MFKSYWKYILNRIISLVTINEQKEDAFDFSQLKQKVEKQWLIIHTGEVKF